MKNPRMASVRAETRTYGTDSPSRQKSSTLSITLSHHPQKKMAQRRTSSTHDSIHTGVIGRCFHAHLAHQTHGANATSLLFSEGQPIRLVETPNPRCQWMMIFHRKKEGSENKYNEKSPKGKCMCRDSNLRHRFT